MCLRIFKYVRQYTSHETQIGIPGPNHNDHGEVFYVMSFTFMVEGWCRNTGEPVDLKRKLFFRIWDLQDPKVRGIQKQDFLGTNKICK